MVRLRLSLKLAVVLTIFFVLVFGVITPIVIRGFQAQQKQALTNQTKAYTILATGPIGEAFMQYRDSGTRLLDERVNGVRTLYTAVTRVAIYDVLAEYQYSTNNQPSVLSRSDAETFEPIFRYDNDGFLQQVVYPLIQENGAHRYTLVYEISSADIRANLDTIQNNILAFGFLIVLLVNLLIIGIIEFLLVRPLRAMSQLASAISAGMYDSSVSLRRRDEIRDLSDALNSMAQKLKADIEALQEAEKLKSEFLIISSHNLRTPLTVVTGYIDLLKDMPLDESAQKYVSQIESKARELTELTNDMLTVAELEGGAKPKLQLQAVDIISMLQDVEAEMQKRIAEKHVSFELSIPDEQVSIKSQSTYLQTALWNLLDNAIKFTPEEGKISLRLIAHTDTIDIQVTDSGVGIAPEELPKLFTKFHRGTSIMEYEYEGVGLGLYMTKLMLDLLGGSISIESDLAKGSTFTITLPKS